MEYYSSVLIYVNHKEILGESDVSKAFYFSHADSYFPQRNIGDQFWFRPELCSSPAIEEFLGELEKRTPIKVFKSCGFFRLDYPRIYSRSERYTYDYIIHSLIRIPAIAGDLGIKSDSFQELLDGVISKEFHDSFEIHFSFCDVLDKLYPKTLSKKQIKNLAVPYSRTELIAELLRPVAVQHIPSGKFLQAEFFDSNIVESLKINGREDLLREILGDSKKRIKVFPLNVKFRLYAV